MSFKEELARRAKMCNRELDAVLKNLPEADSILYKAMAYSLKSGGKRLRMIMLLECAELFDENSVRAVPFACALEMIHTYSLIHDDLPAMDDSDLRRGRPSSHKVFGEDIAVLAGDGLLNYAFEIMLLHSLKEKDNCCMYLEAMNEIAAGAGVFGMILGQTIDVVNENKSMESDLLEFMHTRKTGAMFKGAMRAGAIIGGADKQQVNTVTDYAHDFGLAFQITDDILDETGDAKKLGKATGTDRANNKCTYVTLLGVEAARKNAASHIERAVRTISPLDKNGFFCDLCRYIASRDS